MIRLAIAASLFVTAAHAETPKEEVYQSRNLAFCGSQVATLAWFYQGVVNDGSPELKPKLDDLLRIQSIFLGQVKHDGEETVAEFQKMTKASVADLIEKMGGTEEEGAVAFSDVNLNVRGCVDLYFEKVEEDSADTPKKN